MGHIISKFESIIKKKKEEEKIENLIKFCFKTLMWSGDVDIIKVK